MIALYQYMNNVGENARNASKMLSNASSKQKNCVLALIKQHLLTEKDSLLKANMVDVHNAIEKQYDKVFVDRLKLDQTHIDMMIEGVEQVIQLADPIGSITELKSMPSGINVGKMRVPLGVIGIIYESRPNVTIDATILCIKSGNAVILRGGSEAFYTNQAMAQIIELALLEANFPPHCVQMINTTDRDAVGYMLQQTEYIDVIIPRGGNSLVARINAESKIPVIKHLSGVCHTFVDKHADLDMAVSICDNAKTQRYAPCNTMETLLIDVEIAGIFLPLIGNIYQSKQVEMRVCNDSALIMRQHDIEHLLARDADWTTEYSAPIISIKIVNGLDAAILHINQYGSHHTDVIVTNNHPNAMHFLRAVDSASVMLNASSRFTDGFEFGLGAEIGISTDKLHARGPVGLEGLTSSKFIVLGHGEIRV